MTRVLLTGVIASIVGLVSAYWTYPLWGMLGVIGITIAVWVGLYLISLFPVEIVAGVADAFSDINFFD